MKKVVRNLGLLAVAVCLCLSLAACGSDTGTYKGSYTMEEDGISMTMEMSITLKKDGTCDMTTKMTMDGESEEETISGTYKIDGDKITITVDGDDSVYNYKKGKSITIEVGDGETVELKK